jgi:glycosyltransferase involved in cell wall biosynthesis
MLATARPILETGVTRFTSEHIQLASQRITHQLTTGATLSVYKGIRVGVVAKTGYFGGAERYIERLRASSLPSSLAMTLFGEIEGWGGQRVPISMGKKWLSKSLPLGLARIGIERPRVRAATRNQHVDVFHLHFKREQVAFTSLLARQAPVIWTEHGIFPSGLFGLALRPLYKRASRNVSTIACVSDVVAANIRKIVGSSADVIVINNSIDTAKFVVSGPLQRKAAKSNLGTNVTRPLAAFIGRIEESKRPDLAILAARKAGIDIALAGSGSMLEKLQVAYSTTESVRFLGPLENPGPLLAASDVHLFTSNGDGEGFPTVLIEASCSGIPSVIAADSGFAAWAEDSGGREANPDAESFALAISQVLDDPTASMKARSWGLQYDIASWAEAHRKLYLRTIARSKIEDDDACSLASRSDQ